MFEKIHSFAFREQMLEEMLDLDNEVFLMPLTIHEKTWLKSLLQSDEVGFFLKPETIQKLENLLKDVDVVDSSHLFEKFKFELHVEDDVDFLSNTYKIVRQCIFNQRGFILTYYTNDGTQHQNLSGIPFRLEYLVHKKQWSVIWISTESNVAEPELEQEPEPELIYTPLRKIKTVQGFEVDVATSQHFSKVFSDLIHKDKSTARIVINQTVFKQHSIDEEKQRIFYALSGFDKELFYDEATNEYEMIIYYRPAEVENLLQKLRMLGRRIIINEPEELRVRMVNTAQRSLQRYGI